VYLDKVEWLFNIDWRQMLVPQSSILEMVVRGTLMYLGMFILLRIFRRQAGSVSIADLLLIVIIADAAQNGMAGEAKSVTEALALIVVIVFWDYTLDWLGFSSKLMSRVLEPQPVVMVRNGRMLRRNMKQEMITEDELIGQLREQGIDEIGDVRECRLESNGEFSVIKRSGNGKQGNKKKQAGVK
jgi:uncharacterized membrane protein YcaP (DUF421 family)